MFFRRNHQYPNRYFFSQYMYVFISKVIFSGALNMCVSFSIPRDVTGITHSHKFVMLILAKLRKLLWLRKNIDYFFKCTPACILFFKFTYFKHFLVGDQAPSPDHSPFILGFSAGSGFALKSTALICPEYEHPSRKFYLDPQSTLFSFLVVVVKDATMMSRH